MGRVAESSLLRAFISFIVSITFILVLMYGARQWSLRKTATTTISTFTTNTQSQIQLSPPPNLSDSIIVLIPLSILLVVSVILVYVLKMRRVEETVETTFKPKPIIVKVGKARRTHPARAKTVREPEPIKIMPRTKLISFTGRSINGALKTGRVGRFYLNSGEIWRFSEERVKATLHMFDLNKFNLIFDDKIIIVESISPQKIVSILNEHNEVRESNISTCRIEYHPQSLRTIREKVLEAYRIGISTFIIFKRVHSKAYLNPSRVKKIAAYEYVKHVSSKTIPEDISWTIYGKAFHQAVIELLKTKSLTDALTVFKTTITTNSIGKMMSGDELESAERECEKALKKFMETDLFREYGVKYIRAKPRTILIDDVAAVYATPDFRSKDSSIVIDLKTFIPDKSIEDLERVEKQMKIFQLAYPGAKGVILAFPYKEQYDKPYLKEYEPLKIEEALNYLLELKKYCLEAGEELEIDFSRTETVRYLTKEDGFTVEVYDLDIVKALNLPREWGKTYNTGRKLERGSRYRGG